MSKLYFPSLCFLFWVVLFGCNSKGKEQPSTFELIPTGNLIEFSLDDSTKNISDGLQYFKDDKEYLMNVKWDANSIQIYDFASGRRVKELKFDQEGPNGVGPVFGVFPLSIDSIFLFNPPFTSNFFLTNSEGKIVDRFEYQVPEGAGSAFVHNAFMNSPPIRSGNLLAVKHRFPANLREMTSDQLSSKTLGYQVDLNTGEVKESNHHFPSDYLDTGLKLLEFSRVKGKDRIVYSFFGDSKLYFAPSFEDPLMSKEAGSSFLDERMETFNPNSTSFEFGKYNSAASSYGSIYYDSYRNVYYRFANPTQNVETEEDLIALRQNPGSFVVMVFDKNLELLTEKKFEAGIYYPSNSFVGEKGLYLSTNNPQNPEIKEDWMVFELIELVGK